METEHRAKAVTQSVSLSIDSSSLDLIEQLLNVVQECSNDGWDGYEAKAITDQTLAQALSFLQTLPSAAPAPHVSAHPDGELAFTWSVAPRRILSVSVSSAGRLSFASLNGYRTLHGSEYLVSDLPDSIAFALREVLVSARNKALHQAP
jgi:hypothetical protein